MYIAHLQRLFSLLSLMNDQVMFNQWPARTASKNRQKPLLCVTQHWIIVCKPFKTRHYWNFAVIWSKFSNQITFFNRVLLKCLKTAKHIFISSVTHNNHKYINVLLSVCSPRRCSFNVSKANLHDENIQPPDLEHRKYFQCKGTKTDKHDRHFRNLVSKLYKLNVSSYPA